MKRFIFRMIGTRAILLEGDSVPTDRAYLSLEGGTEGALILGGKHFSLEKEGALLSAEAFTCGIYTPTFFVEGKRYEGPPISVGGGYFSFLPPTHAQVSRLEQRLQLLEASHAELTKRICRIESHLQDTNIF
jgi:hypothetical protein